MHAPLGGPAIVLAMVAAGWAGCLGPSDPADLQVGPADDWTPGTGIDEDKLTQPVHAILDQFVHYVPSEFDDILLHVEVYLPDGDGPWPTIFEHSPYHLTRVDGELDGTPSSVTGVSMRPGVVNTYVPLGYAVVIGHVRGTGNSEGCLDHMGHKEQADTASVIEWIAEQDWSDGKVGMYGISYVGTTPHQGLVMAPEPLVTVVTAAGVTNQWRNTYQNGVPYDGRHYPLTYNAFSIPPPFDVERGPLWALNVANAACDQEEAVRAMSPGTYEKGVYDDYWHERNLTALAANAKASILYNQGFVDRAVNPMEAIFWFNELPVEKKAFIHQQGHSWPGRSDYELVEHAWFDHWLKGIDNGVMDTPVVEVETNVDTVRRGTHWPPLDATPHRLNLAPGSLSPDPTDEGSETYVADMARNAENGGPAEAFLTSAIETAEGLPTELRYVSEPLDDELYMAGVPWMHLEASVDAPNTYFLFDLYDVAPDGTWSRVQEAWMNAHLHAGFDKSSPLTPGEPYRFDFRFEPREYVFEPGHRIGLAVHGHDSRVFPVDELVTRNTINYGADGSWLELPVLDHPVTKPADPVR